MAEIKHFKVVASLPSPLEPDSIYYVRVGLGYDQYVTNGVGIVVAYEANSKLDLESKVDKESGKQLSDENYTLDEKNKLASLENYDDSTVQAELDTKVDKIVGKGLSTEDFTSAEKVKLAELENFDDSVIQAELATKVDKVDGKQLSTEDYSTEEKNKLSGVEAGAQVNTVTSVAGKTGAVTVTKADVGLSNVNNTSDANKPVSTAQQAALDLKADRSSLGTAATRNVGEGSGNVMEVGAFGLGATSAVPPPSNDLDAHNIAAGLYSITTKTTGSAIPNSSGTALVIRSAVTGGGASQLYILGNNVDTTRALIRHSGNDGDYRPWRELWHSGNLLNIGTTAATARTALGLGAQATRWPTFAEVTGKPSTYAPSGHTHPWTQVTGQPATATRWPTFDEVTEKPVVIAAGATQAAARTAIGLGNVNNTRDLDKTVGSFTIHDTRSVVSVPNNVPSKTGLFEFKFVASVGNPPKPSSSTYAHVLTTNGWNADGSGGWPTQVSLGDALSFRKGTGATTWGQWHELISTNTTLGATGQSSLYPMTQKAVTDGLNTKANTSTQVIAGTGLSGGGSLAANRTLSVNYGTTANTAAQGNDSRLSNSREWAASTVSQSEAEAGTATTRRAWTAQRVRQAIAGWWTGSADKAKLDGIAAGAQVNVATNLGSSGTGATRTITSSTGSNTSITYSAADVGAVPTARTITAGTGLTGGGTLAANRTLAVTYGTAAGTAAQGNDSRLSNSREWTAATITQAEAEAGTATTRRAFTAQRLRQGITAWYTGISGTIGRTILGKSTAAEVRGVLQLGTAATVDVGESSGNVMEVGAFGLGGIAARYPRIDWQEMPSTFAHIGNESVVGGPPVGHGYGTAFVAAYSSTNYSTLYFPNYGGTGPWYRTGGNSGRWRNIYSTENTTKSPDGTLKASSPVINLYTDHHDLHNEEQFGATPVFTRKSKGVYEITGTLGLRSEGWYLDTPSDRNGNKYFNIEWTQNITPEAEDGVVDKYRDDIVVTIKTFERVWDKDTGLFENGAPMDINELQDRFVQLRFNELKVELREV